MNDLASVSSQGRCRYAPVRRLLPFFFLFLLKNCSNIECSSPLFKTAFSAFFSGRFSHCWYPFSFFVFIIFYFLLSLLCCIRLSPIKAFELKVLTHFLFLFSRIPSGPAKKQKKKNFQKCTSHFRYAFLLWTENHHRAYSQGLTYVVTKDGTHEKPP